MYNFQIVALHQNQCDTAGAASFFTLPLCAWCVDEVMYRCVLSARRDSADCNSSKHTPDTV